MRKMLYILSFLSLILAPGCFDMGTTKKTEKQPTKEVSLKLITAEQLKDRMKKVPGLTVVNVLSEESFTNCHIRSSINVPLDKIAEKAKWWNKDKELVLYCASYECQASKNAYEILREIGFSNIAAYEGGMKEWREKAFDIEGPCK